MCMTSHSGTCAVGLGSGTDEHRIRGLDEGDRGRRHVARHGLRALPPRRVEREAVRAIVDAVTVCVVAEGACSVLALGSIGGGHAGAHFSNHPAAKRWAFRLLVMVIVLEVVHLGWHYAAPLRAA